MRTYQQTKGGIYYIDFRDNTQRRRRLAGFSDRRRTGDLASKITELLASQYAGGLTPELQQWIERLPERYTRRFVRWGLLSGQRVAAKKTLLEHLDDWQQALFATSNTRQYAQCQRDRVKSIFTASGFIYWQDIQASKLQQEISKLKKTVKAKNEKDILCDKILGDISQTTKNYYLKACQQFCRWMVKDGRASQTPLEHLTPAKTTSRKRIALEIEGIRQLLTYTDTAGVSFGLKGFQRSILYRVAMETGFRAGEIRCLKISDFDLKGGYVKLSGTHTKNGIDAEIPIRPELIEKLKSYFKGKLPQVQAFKMPYNTNLARMFRADLDSAKVKIESDTGLIDFHSLRHTFGSLLAASGCHPKTAQQLMRHSDINLTMSRYSHVFRGQESTAIASLPDLDKLPENQRQQKTGTNDIFENCQNTAISMPQNERKPETTGKMGLISGVSGNLDIDSKTGFLAEKGIKDIMGRGGFEPPTHGFSVHISPYK